MRIAQMIIADETYLYLSSLVSIKLFSLRTWNDIAFTQREVKIQTAAEIPNCRDDKVNKS